MPRLTVAAAFCAFVATACTVPAPPASAEEPVVVAVVACDPYADLKKQIRWVGTLVDQPTLDGFAESFIMMATQFKGLAGLDVSRPAGLVLTVADDVPAVHAYVPVKDLGKLLDAIEGITGPADQDPDGVRHIAPPGGPPLDVVERDGWAIIGLQGVAPAVTDPTPLLDAVAKPFTLGVQAFPARMTERMRALLRGVVDQFAVDAASLGRPIDPNSITDMMEGLDDVESLLFGACIDMERERVFLELRHKVVPQAEAAEIIAGMAKGAVTVASPATADGKPAAVSLHLAMALPEAVRPAAIAGLETIRAAEGSDAGMTTAVAVLKETLAAMIRAGAADAAVTVDTSGVAGDVQDLVPAVTGGVRVKDGAALEAAVKKIVAGAGEIPGLEVKFDTGKAAGANLHTLSIAGKNPLEVTLAIAPGYAWVLAGDDVPARLAAVAAASGKPDAAVKPMADLNMALGPLLRYAAAGAKASGDDAADPDGLAAAAALADEQPSALVQLLMRPIERGIAMRVSADAGAIRTVASVKPKVGPPAGQLGVPATEHAAPIPFPIPQ